MKKEDLSLILLGAGRGKRYGKEKQFEEINGIPVILIALENFKEFVSNVYIVLHKRRRLEVSYPFDYSVVKGGEKRQDSVWNALSYINTDFVIIHDGARPLVSEEVIQKGLFYLKQRKNAIPGIKVRDTIREWKGDVMKTIDREFLYLIQTPQFFLTKDIKEGYEFVLKNKKEITDDASSLEYIGKEFVIFEGDPENIKVTYREDIRVVECLLNLRKKRGEC